MARINIKSNSKMYNLINTTELTMLEQQKTIRNERKIIIKNLIKQTQQIAGLTPKKKNRKYCDLPQIRYPFI